VTKQRMQADGQLSFVPAAPSDSASVVAELDVLLTGGRLSPASRAVIQDAYDATFANSSSANEALRIAQELFIGAAMQRPASCALAR
jgi:hypothetical protein